MRRLFERFLPVQNKGNEPRSKDKVTVGIAAMDKKVGVQMLLNYGDKHGITRPSSSLH